MTTINGDTQEKPRLKPLEVVQSYWPWLTFAITVLSFILSPLTLPVSWYVFILLAIMCIAYLIYLGLYAVRYMKYLRGKERNFNGLTQLYGKQQSELLKMKKEIGDFRRLQIRNFFLGAFRGIQAKSNESLVSLADEDIGISGKRSDNNGLELIFEKGAKAGIEKGTLLSILTSWGDLWGVVQIDEVGEDNCKGHAVSRLNQNFWRKVEDDALCDPSPPVGIKARLYYTEHLETEIKTWIEEIEAL